MVKNLRRFLSLGILCTFLVSTASVVTAEAKPNKDLKIAVLSDAHYFPKEYVSIGNALNQYLSTDRKLIAESSYILKSTVSEIRKSTADIVLVTGDLTKDGEKESHLQFAKKLKELESSGKKVFVIPGNHDINNPHAVKYVGDEAIPVENIKPSDFSKIYKKYGYDEAISRDPNSLSYVAEPVKGLRIIAMDSCIYDTNMENGRPTTEGGFTAARLKWIKKQIIEAKAKNKRIIGMMHHGMIEHFSAQDEFFSEYVIADFDKVSSELADLGLEVVFTGHFHAQDITKKTTENNRTIYDIQTGSLVSYPCAYRTVKINHNGMEIQSKTIKMIAYNTDGKSFQQYASDDLTQGLNILVPQILAGLVVKKGIPKEQAVPYSKQILGTELMPSYTVNNLICDAMKANYVGDEVMDPLKKQIVKNMLGSQNPMTSMLGGAVNSLMNDTNTADNNALIPIYVALKKLH